MASKLEVYKSSQDILSDQSDLELLLELYKAPDNKVEGWTDFVNDYTINEDTPSHIRRSFIPMDKEEEQKYLQRSNNTAGMKVRDVSKAIFNLGTKGGLAGIAPTIVQSVAESQVQDSKKLKQKGLLQDIAPRGTRKVLAGITEDVIGGTLDLGRDVIESIGQADYDTLGIKKDYKLPKELKQIKRDTISRGVQAVFGNDILYPTIDEDGVTYYAVEQPEWIGGQLVRLGGSVATPALAAKRAMKTATERVVKWKRKGKRGRPSNKELKNLDRVNVAQNLTAAELGFQIAVSPEEARFAYDLGQWAILNENDSSSRVKSLTARIFKYLDLEDPAQLSAMENRLGLLLENMFMVGGILATFKYGPKGLSYIPSEAVTTPARKTKESVQAVLAYLRQLRGDPQAMASFKKTLEKSSNTPSSALKLKTEVKEDVAKLGKLSQAPTFESMPKVQRFLDAMYNVRQKVFTSEGTLTPKIFHIIRNAENTEKAMAERALYLTGRIEGGLKQAAKEIGTVRKDYRKVNNLFKDVLNGKAKINELPKHLRELALTIRNQVDELADDLVTSGRITDKAQLKEIIKGKGSYLRATFEIFENPSYSPAVAVINQAKLHIADRLRLRKGFRKNDPDNVGLSPQALNDKRLDEAKKIVDNLITNRGTISAAEGKLFNIHLEKMYGTKSADKIWAAKKTIDPVIRDLLGETKNVSTIVFRTITEMSNYMTKMQMYDDLYNAGKGKYFFREGETVKDVRLTKGSIGYLKDGRRNIILDEAGKPIETGKFGSLTGVRTTEQIAKLVENASIHIPYITTAYGYLLGMKGFGQSAATVLNHITHMRNTIGQSVIMGENGLNPAGKETQQSFRVLTNQFKNAKNRDEAIQSLYEKYQKLGIVNQNVKVREFTRLVNKSGIKTIDLLAKESLLTRGWTPLKGIKKVHQTTTQLYTAEDDLFRIATYEKELKVLQTANRGLPKVQRVSAEALELKAAEIVRNTMPTYDLVPYAARWLRKLPVGNFFSFTAERLRNTYHTLARGVEEIGSSSQVIRERGYQRLGAKLAYSYMSYEGITEATKLAAGVTDQMHEAVKNLLLPYWAKNSSVAYYRDDDGNLMYMDLSYSDPDAPVMDAVRAFMNELTDPNEPQEGKLENIGNAVAAGFIKYLDPFISEALLTEAVVTSTLRDGRNAETGARIKGWKPDEAWYSADNLTTSMFYVTKTLIPGSYKSLAPEAVGGKKGSLGEHLIKSLQGKPYERYGKPISPELEVFAHATGMRFYSISDNEIEKAYYFKMKDYKNAREIKQKQINNSIADGVPVERVLEEIREANEDFFPYYVKAKLAIEGAEDLDLPRSLIKKEIWSIPNTTKQERSLLITANNFYVPLNLSDTQLKRIHSLNDFSNMSYIEFKRQYMQLNENFSSLPLVDYIKHSKNVDYDILTSPYQDTRFKKFTGGKISKDYPVTDVAENPADRDLAGEGVSFNEVAADKENPYPTYEDEMKRLGFADAGEVLGEGSDPIVTTENTLRLKEILQTNTKLSDSYKRQQVERLFQKFPDEFKNFKIEDGLKNYDRLLTFMSLLESSGGTTDRNIYQMKEGAIIDSRKNLKTHKRVPEKFINSISNNPRDWDKPTHDIMATAYLNLQDLSDNHLKEILKGNYGEMGEGAARRLYEDHWLRKPFVEYQELYPDDDVQGNWSRGWNNVISPYITEKDIERFGIELPWQHVPTFEQQRQKFSEGERVGVETDYGSTKVGDKDIKNLLKGSLALLQPSNDISLEDIQKAKSSLWSGPDKFPIEEDIFMNNLMPLLKTKQGNMASSAWREHKALIPLTEAVIRDYLYPQEESRYNKQYPNYTDSISTKPAMNAMSWHLQQERDRQDEEMNPTKLADILNIPFDKAAEFASSLLSRRE